MKCTRFWVKPCGRGNWKEIQMDVTESVVLTVGQVLQVEGSCWRMRVVRVRKEVHPEWIVRIR